MVKAIIAAFLISTSAHGAWRFFGADGSDTGGYLRVDIPASFVQSDATSYTVSTWVIHDTPATDNYINWFVVGTYNWNVLCVSAKSWAYFYGGQYADHLQKAPLYTDGDLANIITTCSNKTISGYINGVKTSGELTLNNYNGVSGAGAYIGWHNYPGAPEIRYTRGVIDDVRLYNRILSEAEIMQLYLSRGADLQRAASDSSCVMIMRSGSADEQLEIGSTVYDRSQGHNNFSVSNVVRTIPSFLSKGRLSSW